MLTPEKTTNFKLEIPQTPENQRITIAYHDYFSKFHHDFHRSIVKLLQQDTNNQEIPGRGFPIGYLHGFGNKSQIYAALEKTDTGKSDAVIAPVWFAPPEADSLYSILQICSSFTQSSSSENNTITDNLILVFHMQN